MIITFDDPKHEGEVREFEFDLDEMDLKQAQYLKRQLGMTPLALQEGLDQVDPDALLALYWLMCKQNGVTVDPAKVNFKVAKFGAALNAAAKAERELREAADEEDPTEGDEPATI